MTLACPCESHEFFSSVRRDILHHTLYTKFILFCSIRLDHAAVCVTVSTLPVRVDVLIKKSDFFFFFGAGYGAEGKNDVTRRSVAAEWLAFLLCILKLTCKF